MTEATTRPAPAQPHRRGDSGLYTPLSWGLVRAPLLSTDAAEGAGTPSPDGSLLPADPRVRAALGVASPDLSAALARTGPGDGKAGRLCGKLLRYLIRMSTRPTPFGLFAGVGLVGWGPRTDLALAAGRPRTRTRPDMEWLLGFVAHLERDPAVRSAVRLVASTSVVLRGGRAFRMGTGVPAVSVRATGAVRRALDLARAPITHARLVEELGTAPGATREKAERLLDELWRQGFLTSDLQPALTGPDPAGQVRDRLAAVPAAREAGDALGALLTGLAAWDGLPLDARPEAWPGLVAQARALHPAPPSAVPLQTDMALPLAGTRVHDGVPVEAARAGELLVRLSPHPQGSPRLDAYRRAFEGRYGPDREVPLLELLDPDLGLGPPGDRTAEAGGAQVPAVRQHVLRELALDAHRNRRLVIELDDTLLERLAPGAPSAGSAPPSLDISAFVSAATPDAIDAGDFLIVVGPNIGATGAGRNLGRFADLLGPPAWAALEEVADREAALAPGTLQAEVVYLPERTRSANVAVRPAVRTHEIVISARPGVDANRVIPLDQLAVGLRNGRFTVRWPAAGADVVAVQGHMLNLLQAPAAARFLLEVAGDGQGLLASFNWGPAAAFPFLPRVQRGRIVLALAQWRVDGAADLATTPAGAFPAALEAWRAEWAVPRHVYLAAGDNRLLLDLDAPDHAELLRDELSRLAEGHGLVLQEALPGPSEAWLPGADGGHIVEVVVPLALRTPRAPAEKPPTGSVSPRARLRLPGSDWLYLKLYAPRVFTDELIAGPLRSFGEFATTAGLCEGWFFLRYADPDPHLRVRFHGDPSVLLGALLQQACAWASELVGEGTCTRFAFDTYEREVERYGGEDGMRAAEMVFTADSETVADLLRLSRLGEFPLDLTALTALSIDALLGGVGLGPEERRELYREAATPTQEGGQEYRERQRELRPLLGDPGTLMELRGGAGLRALLEARAAALAPAAALLDALECRGRLSQPRVRLCRTYIHLHANRLLGSNPPDEHRVLELLRRTRDGLSRAPLTGLATRRHA